MFLFLERRAAAAAAAASLRELYPLCRNVVNPCRQPPPCPGAPAARSGCWDYLKGEHRGRERNSPRLPPPVSAFSPTASIKLCQLLPRAKPCLRETDLKGPKSAEQPHRELTAPPSQPGRSWKCSRRGQGRRFWSRTVWKQQSASTLPGRGEHTQTEKKLYMVGFQSASEEQQRLDLLDGL